MTFFSLCVKEANNVTVFEAWLYFVEGREIGAFLSEGTSVLLLCLICCLKALNAAFGYCQRPVFPLGVSQHTNKTTTP